MPDHVESMRKEVAAHDRASFFKLHNLAGDRYIVPQCHAHAKCKLRVLVQGMLQGFRNVTGDLSAFSYLQVAWHMPGMTKLFGKCSSAPQLSGTSALTCESQRSSLTARWAGMPFFKLL